MLKKVNAIEPGNPSYLVKNADYNTKTDEIEKKILDHDHNNKHIITQEFNKLKAGNFTARCSRKDAV